MKALAKLHAEPGIWMTDTEQPEYGYNDLLIKIKKTAICGTDVHIYKWDEWSQKPFQYLWLSVMNTSAKSLLWAMVSAVLQKATGFRAKAISPVVIAVTAVLADAISAATPSASG